MKRSRRREGSKSREWCCTNKNISNIRMIYRANKQKEYAVKEEGKGSHIGNEAKEKDSEEGKSRLIADIP